MGNDKDKIVEKNNEKAISSQERSQDSHEQMGRININDINKRNAEQEKQEKKSSYTVAGIVIILIVFIMVAVYFFS